jgi:predicted hydrocarbon binding protein
MDIAAKLGLADSAQILKLISVNLFNTMGYGKIEVRTLKTNPTKAIIRVYDSFECELGMGNGKPYSSFIRGMVAGFLTGLFNEKMNAKETLCIAKRDPYCEFTIKPEKSVQ